MKTTAERQKAWRTKRKAEGFSVVTVWLEPDVVTMLDAVAKGPGQHAERQRIINAALREFLAGS